METLLATLLAFAAMTSAANDDTRNALVFGGTGRLGAPIVHLLADAGYTVTVFARASSDRGRLEDLDIDYLTGDLMDAGSVKAALGGRSYALVVDATSRGNSRDSFYDTAMVNILAALDAARVGHFILHGSVGAGDNMKAFPNIDFDRMRAVMLAKGRAEVMLKESGIAYTIIRNGRVMVDGTPATGTARLVEDDTVLGTATRLDLAALTLGCIDNPDCRNKTFHAVDASFD